MRVIEDVFSWLPLATVIDDEILVVHGGISDVTNIDFINSINRHKVCFHRSLRDKEFEECCGSRLYNKNMNMLRLKVACVHYCVY